MDIAPQEVPQADIGVARSQADGLGDGDKERRIDTLEELRFQLQLFQRLPSDRVLGVLILLDVATRGQPELGLYVIA